MAKNVVIFPLSVALEIDQKKSIDAFVKLGVPRWQIYWHYYAFRQILFTPLRYLLPFRPVQNFLEKNRGISLSRLFQEYNLGAYDYNSSREAIQAVFPTVKKLSNQENFVSAWNVMVSITGRTDTIFSELEVLKQQGVSVVLITNSNDLHIEWIKLKYLELYEKDLPGEIFSSFYEKKMGMNLIRSLITKIKLKDKSNELPRIALFYSPPNKPTGYNPIEHISYFWAKRYVSSLIKSGEKQGYLYTALDFTSGKMQEILTKAGFVIKPPASRPARAPFVPPPSWGMMMSSNAPSAQPRTQAEEAGPEEEKKDEYGLVNKLRSRRL